MAAPILYYWGPCATCALVTSFADEHDIELDKRDVEQVEPYNELLALGGNADFIRTCMTTRSSTTASRRSTRISRRSTRPRRC